MNRLATAFLPHMAEAERFELSVDCSTPPFQGGALDRYATPPPYVGIAIYNTITSLLCKSGTIFAHYLPAGRQGPLCDVSALVRDRISKFIPHQFHFVDTKKLRATSRILILYSFFFKLVRGMRLKPLSHSSAICRNFSL